DVQEELAAGQRVDHVDLRERDPLRVLIGLLEELARERDVALVDAVDDREIRHIRCAVVSDRTDRGRNHPLEAGRDRLERHLEWGGWGAHSACPAVGPGVWSKARSTEKSTRTVSCIHRFRITCG